MWQLVASRPYRSSCGEVLGCYIHHITSVPLISFPSLSEMRLHLPSGLPKQLEKSLSSCCHQSDALWEALEKFRGIWVEIGYFRRVWRLWGGMQRYLG